jgi:putative transposase
MSDALRVRLIEAILRLPPEDLHRAEAALASLGPKREAAATPTITWPHAPPHCLSTTGTYIVTAATLDHEHHFRGPDRLDHLLAALLDAARESGWQLEAWAAFSNHYHFVAHAAEAAVPIRDLIRRVHGRTAVWVNREDGTAGRQVWHNFWDTRLTYEASYLARLNYVHQNPVKHGLVPSARLYRWCSADWFERTATPAQVATVAAMKIDRVNVHDDFDPV